MQIPEIVSKKVFFTSLTLTPALLGFRNSNSYFREAQAALHRCAAEVPAMPTPITSSFAAAPIMRLCRSPPLRLR